MTLSWILTACTGQEPCADGYGRNNAGACVLLDPAADDGGGDGGDGGATVIPDTGGGGGGDPDAPMPDWKLGDVLVETANLDLEEDYFFEGVDALAIDDTYAFMTGQGGWYAFDMANAEEVMFRAGERGYDLAYDASLDRVYVGTRYSSVYCVDVSDPPDFAMDASCGVASDKEYEDIAADGGLVLLAAQSGGARLYDSDGDPIGTLDGDDASGVGLYDGRAVVVDGDELVYWDLSDTDAPTELDRLELDASGGDVAFDGSRVLVAMGAEGVAVVDIDGDTLVDRDSFDVQGSANQVALDGNYAYSASWTGFEVAWVGTDGPLVLGHEDAVQLAFGIAAQGGNVAVADWFHARSFTHDRSLAGPEIDAPDYVYFTESSGSEAFTIKNAGAMDLDVELAVDDDYVLDTDEMTLVPGEAATVVVTANGEPADGPIVLTTNDPDEPTLEVRATWGQNLLGTTIENFEMTGFEWPSKTKEAYRSSDYYGKVIFLAFWAEY